MNGRTLMITSALMLAAIGLVLSFAPDETLVRLGAPGIGGLGVLLQLAGALFLGFALMNWTAKGMVLGGIYGRAVVIGNLMHFTVGALALLKVDLAAVHGPLVWTGTVVYAVFAIAFGRMLFSTPPQVGTTR